MLIYTEHEPTNRERLGPGRPAARAAGLKAVGSRPGHGLPPSSGRLGQVDSLAVDRVNGREVALAYESAHSRFPYSRFCRESEELSR